MAGAAMARLKTEGAVGSVRVCLQVQRRRREIVSDSLRHQCCMACLG
jgi:hypothetical protein